MILKIRLKRGRIIHSKDITTQKRRTQRKIGVPEKANIEQMAPIEAFCELKALIKAYDKQKVPT